jgi:uncharacterized protein YecE (DUF72 family)
MDTRSKIKVGCCGFAGGQRDYFERFELIEIQQTFYQPPRLPTAEKWRAAARKGFEFTLKAWQLITGALYPEGLKPPQWLGYYARHFDTVEVNNTFYHLPEERVFETWREQTPVGFTFALKASRFITHMKKLAQPEEHVARFLRRASGLRHKLGIVLFQLPPFWKFNPERLERLCAFVRRQKIVPHLRAALEVRHASWLCEECFEMLRRHNVALVLADWPDLDVRGPLTADFVFVRRHGPGSLYASNYPDTTLRRDARSVRAWLAEGRDVHVYFNNDVCAYAVCNAQTLNRFVRV